MARARIDFVCTDCGTAHPKWVGQCSGCGRWNSLAEEVVVPRPELALVAPTNAATPIGDVDPQASAPQPTGIGELDRVLGGGIVPGSVTLLGGEPGIGKSTLLLQLLARWPRPALYVTAEESAQQVRRRGERLDAIRPDLWLLAETVLPHVLAAVDSVQPSIVVIDSIQTVLDPALGSPAGSVVQVRGCAQQLVTLAKQRGIPVVLVGHVTKEGSLAGPRVLEHVVDTVLAFEGERHHALRLVRASKHRYGPTSELGLFEMVGDGLIGVPDPSGLFLGDRRTGVPGSAVVPTVEGQRPLLVEVQALTAAGREGVPPRRTANGIDTNRLAMLLAVLQQRARVSTATYDVYASAVGGVRLAEPGPDLALCLAIVSAITDVPIAPDLVAFGEVGLGGEIRQVAHAPRRLAEAARLGFRRAICPRNAPTSDAGLRLVRVTTLAEAIAAAGLSG